MIATLDESRNPVYRAMEAATGREVAVKLLDRLKEPVVPKWLDRRSRVLGSLARRDVGYAPAIEAGFLSSGEPFIVLPFYEDGSLQDLLARSAVSWERASRLIERACRVVAEAHDQALVLGDLRPSAILLDGFDTPVVAAFGMASFRFDDGTPTYEAPERAQRQRLTPAADVYSLAAVLAALVVGRPRQRDEATATYLRQVAEAAPAAVVRVIEHAMSERADNRYGDARLFGRALHDAAERAGRAAVPDDPTTARSEHADETGDGIGPGDGSANGEVAPPGSTGEARVEDDTRPTNDTPRRSVADAPDLEPADWSTPSSTDAIDSTPDQDDLADLLIDLGLADDERGRPSDAPAVGADGDQEADAPAATSAAGIDRPGADATVEQPPPPRAIDARPGPAGADAPPPPPTAADAIKLDTEPEADPATTPEPEADQLTDPATTSEPEADPATTPEPEAAPAHRPGHHLRTRSRPGHHPRTRSQPAHRPGHHPGTRSRPGHHPQNQKPTQPTDPATTPEPEADPATTPRTRSQPAHRPGHHPGTRSRPAHRPDGRVGKRDRRSHRARHRVGP